MMGNGTWLDDVVVVNESHDEVSTSGVSIFRSSGEACRYLEPWWVEDAHGYAFTATGIRLALAVDGDRVIIAGQEAIPSGTEIVREWLRVSGAAILEARKWQAKKGKAILSEFEECDQIPTSTEGLIAYIGFSD